MEERCSGKQHGEGTHLLEHVSGQKDHICRGSESERRCQVGSSSLNERSVGHGLHDGEGCEPHVIAKRVNLKRQKQGIPIEHNQTRHETEKNIESQT